MNWFWLALFSVFCSTAMLLCFQRLEKTVPIKGYLSLTWFIGGLILLPMSLTDIRHVTIFYLGITIIAGFFSWGGNYYYNLAIKSQENIGYIEALSSIKVVIGFIVSILFINDNLHLSKVLGVIGILAGVILVSWRSGKHKTYLNSYWARYSLISGVFFAGIILIFKFALAYGFSLYTTVSFTMIVSGVLFFIKSTKADYIHCQHGLPLILMASLFAALANITLITSVNKAPNLSYTMSITNSRIVILFIASIFTTPNTITPIRFLGIVLTAISVILLNI